MCSEVAAETEEDFQRINIPRRTYRVLLNDLEKEEDNDAGMSAETRW